MQNISKKKFIIIFLIIVIVNFAYALTYRIKPMVDAEAYDEIATNIVNREEYRASESTPLNMDGAITRVGPGYELFLASNYLFFGRHLWIIWLIQAILYGLTISMLGILSIKLFPTLKENMKSVYAGMIVFGLLIDMIQLNGMLMTESLFTFLLVLSFFIWSKIYENENSSVWWWILLGLELGALTLTRPTGLIVFILILGVSIYRFRLKKIIPMILLVLLFLIIQLPWFIRNYRVYNHIIFHSTADGMNFLSGNYPGNHGEFNSDFPLFKEYKEKYPSPVEFNTAAKSWYRDFVIHHPIQAIGVIAEKSIIFFSLAKTSGFWFHYHSKFDQILTILISIVENFMILGSTILFILLAPKHLWKREINKTEIFILLTLLALSLTPILTVIANRHRLPLVIMTLPLLVYAIDLISREYKRMFWKISIVVLILLVSTSIDVVLQFDKFKERLHRVDKTSHISNSQTYV